MLTESPEQLPSALLLAEPQEAPACPARLPGRAKTRQQLEMKQPLPGPAGQTGSLHTHTHTACVGGGEAGGDGSGEIEGTT